MRVNDLHLTGAATTETGRAQASQPLEREGRTSAAARNGPGSDQVDLSLLSRALHSSDSARNTRIQQLAAQFQAGQYQADPVQVSHAIVGDALQASIDKL